MRYPEGKGNLNNSNASDTQSFRYPSSSTSNSQDPDDESPNIATISEHVLFGNNNGQNSFLYLYYSSSNNYRDRDNQRPYTTGGGGGGTSKKSKMGSNKDQQWGDYSGLRSSRGSAGPSPLSYNLDEYDDEDDKVKNENAGTSGNSDKTPYPVYFTPMEGSPVKAVPPAEKKSQPEASRLDTFTADLLDDDDWDRIYSVPNVDPRYILSPEPTSTSKRVAPTTSSAKRISKQNNSTNSLSVSNISATSSASSINQGRNFSHSSFNSHKNSSRHAKVTRSSRGVGGVSTKKVNSKSVSQTKKLSPATSSINSNSLKRNRSMNMNEEDEANRYSHYNSETVPQMNGNATSLLANNAKRIGSTNTRDGNEFISLSNGIGAFFGTAASKRAKRNQELSPEELYQQELQGWKSRLATGATIFSASLFIMSCSSLLFVFPILVDPILVGFEAQFSRQPVTCRTINFRNGSGPSECAIPSCREGCTLDLFSCIFVEVEYTIDPGINTSAANNAATIDNSSSFSSSQDLDKQRATLLINVNGCGYPPQVTCSDFERKFAPLNTEFPCYYSQQNQSIVVPYYSRRTEIVHLTLAISIPIGIAVFSAISLYFLKRYHFSLKMSIFQKYFTKKKVSKKKSTDIDEEDVTSISELDLVDECQEKQIMIQNGASKNGKLEASSL